MPKGKTVVVWILSVLVAAMFMLTGSFKLAMPAKVHEGFVHYGYSPWFGTFIGICELLGGIGLLIPRLAALAATGLSIIMVGAFFTHAMHHEYANSAGPLILLAILVLIIYMRVKN
jgi:putative oxidoreductase